MATTIPKLRAVEVSPTTLQYAKPRPQKPFYKRVFYPPPAVKDTLSQPWLHATDPLMPKYPYPHDTKYQESRYGLYGGKTIQSGNKISDGRNKGRTMRKWYPNVRVQTLFSKALDVQMTLPVVARVSRTIKKCGGLDEYLTGDKPARVKELGLLGWKLRWLVKNSRSYQAKQQRDARSLGPAASSMASMQANSTFASAWADTETRNRLVQKVAEGWQKLREKEDALRRHTNKTLGASTGRLKLMALHDPMEYALPESFEEEQPTREIPEVKRGYGFSEEEKKAYAAKKTDMRRRGARAQLQAKTKAKTAVSVKGSAATKEVKSSARRTRESSTVKQTVVA